MTCEINNETKSFTDNPIQSEQTSFLGRVALSLFNNERVRNTAAAYLSPSQNKVDQTLNKLKSLASSDDKLIPFIDDLIDLISKKILVDSSYKDYLKNFIGNLFYILGNEALEERDDDAFPCAEDLLSAVLRKISDKITEDIDQLKNMNDEDIARHADHVAEYFLSKVNESGNSALISLVLRFAKSFLNESFTKPLLGYYRYYAEIASAADNLRNKTRFQEIRPSVEKLSDFFRFHMEKQLDHLPTHLGMFLNLKKGEIQKILPDKSRNLLFNILKRHASEFYAKNQNIVEDIEIFFMCPLIDLDGNQSVQQQSADFVRQYIPIFRDEIGKAQVSVRKLREAKAGGLDLLKKELVGFILQERIELLEQRTPVQLARQQLKRLNEENVSDQDLVFMLKPAAGDREVDWSCDFEFLCKEGLQEEDLYHLGLAMIMGPGAKRILNKIAKERFASNHIICDFIKKLGLKLGARHLGKLAHDVHFYQEDLEKELAKSTRYLNELQEGKGEKLIELLGQLVRAGLPDPKEQNHENPVYYGGIAPIMVLPHQGDHLANALLRNAFIIMIARALKSDTISGSNLDDKVQSIFNHFSDIIDHVFGNYEQFLNASEEDKILMVEKEIAQSIVVNYYALLLREKGCSGKEYYHKVYQYYSEFDMSRQAIELLTTEVSFIELLPDSTRDFPIYDGVVASLQNIITPYFEPLYRTYTKLRSEARKVVSDDNQKQLESMVYNFSLRILNEYAETQPDSLAGVGELFGYILAKGGIRGAVGKIQTSNNVLGETAFGVVRKFAENLSGSTESFWSDPSFFPSVLADTSYLTADYFENGLTEADDRFRNQNRFLDDLTSRILERICPDGAAGLPIEKSLQDAGWQNLYTVLRSFIKSHLDQFEDSRQRKILLLKLLKVEGVSPDLSDTQLQEKIEQYVKEFISGKVSDYFKNEIIKLLLFPFIWILTKILVSRAVHATRKLIVKTDQPEFVVFLRKLFWELFPATLDSKEIPGEAEVTKIFQNSVSRIAKKLDVPFANFAASQITLDLLIEKGLTIQKIIHAR